ncbi:hypothetical protein LI055_10495 [Clostridium perfringens]|uniref:hypothetical protein n=1 Tax=Clostridium perfringens TaxID=1502 RepID=UPI0022467185|nr:hypothetical protein [Clostridium perfringens]MCX0380048.1 hypothetical protein [Clostridium perfringens]
MDFRKILKSKKFWISITVIILVILLLFSIVISFSFWGCKKWIPPEIMASIITGFFTLITFLGTVLAICITWRTSKEKSLLEVITKNRADWVKEMKELFSDYFTKYDELEEDKESNNTTKTNRNPDKNNIKGNTLVQIRNKISLRLNPNGVIDNDILESLDDLIKKRDANLRDRLEIKIKLYLKCEWERIKFETKEGLKDYDFDYEFEKIQLINYFGNKKVDYKFINNLLIKGKIPKEFLTEDNQLEEDKIDNFKKNIIIKIKENNFTKDKVIELRENIESKLSKCKKDN